MDKGKFFESGALLDSGVGPKDILVSRVQEMGLGFEQVKVEPEVILPCLNVLGKTTEFAAFVNEVGAPEIIGSPSVCAWLKEVASFYLGGTFVANTCEHLVAQDPRTALAVPAVVKATVAALSLEAAIAQDAGGLKGEPMMVPFASITGWDASDLEDEEKWPLPENPKTKAEDTVPGKWVALNGGAATIKDEGKIVVQFVPEDKLTFAPLFVVIEKPQLTVSDSRPEGLVVKGAGVLHLNNTSAHTDDSLSDMSVSKLELGTGSTAGQVSGLTVSGSDGGEPTVTVALVEPSTTFSCEANGAWTPSTVMVKLTASGFEPAAGVEVEVAVEPLVAGS